VLPKQNKILSHIKTFLISFNLSPKIYTQHLCISFLLIHFVTCILN
jgi:hypothetical protein